MGTAFSDISCVLRWLRTYLRVYGSMHTALLHTPSVFKESGTNSSLYGFMHTDLLHISCVWDKKKKTVGDKKHA